ncbi:DUF1617 family protein [Carnobacterium viridans]|uniref:Phage protein n=1 Tax=Carnobacterium viridans TaxID=174587 RepID=A0A1H0YTX9_9LACT|nr:DUF1617 family protein [Carnobacterium viridans]UDE94947.1 DUF1617 family protein [Carnobacterium viridans]SDQ18629.1 Protein of unknown function [Carnobacterium viridans]
MKTIKLKNSEIVPVYNALENITVQGRQARRGKGKLQKTLSAKNKEFLEDLDDIRSDYFKKKDDGTFAENNGKLIWLDKYKDDPEAQKKANEQTKELNKEVIGIDLVEHESKIKSFFDALEKDEFTGKEALRDEDFETLMELLEEAFEAKEDMKEEEK